ncbi:ABC transporter substrate-binding protein [Mycolicibacterium moriokaense]|jgi:zinc/manganese transport system substrate-binding protein|uniref:ABC transporter solute binding protein n=1 Tax=Mycolicibacterium moriokaense TaxID=39691 RepID=A0AAD1H8U5_9MYCO|nr:zinc ABC transporter substrate-binding protein [Mycolicibacterium moriokaense]MCV7040216.1 zinc ABC transporter substrate-binding protein [Mycolicibacterium moriokaense]ORB20067.1 ABC transporter substrate-binding protein [Mycolicibacterium moriokaense]BBX00231.1 putative ABC transporter solute binding protein [Mycolicibacterium moriokaense]
MRAGLVVATAVGLAIATAGCAGQDASQQKPASPAVVASTDVWGSVAEAVTGDRATVTSILDSAVDDPHSYEATPANAAAIADASLVVFNGGGYDHWVEDVLANNPNVPTVDAYSLLPGAAPGANEHVFYDPATAKAVAAQIADRLATIDATSADTYRANAAAFARTADEILTLERAIGQEHPGASVVATEPVAHYLLTNAGLTDKTPEGFANAIEEDTDPSPADLAAMLDLINTRQVSALLHNPQTETAVTKQLRDAAERASIPVVTVTETLPEGTDYLTWQRQTVEQLASQLDKAPQANR